MTTRKWLASAAVAAALWSGPAFAWGGPGGTWMWGHGRGAWGGMMGGGLPIVIFWALIIFLVVLSARWFDGKPMLRRSESPSRRDALDILQERYARGEIDQAEYEARRRTLAGR